VSERLRITYELTCARDESPEVKARGIALEQTVELPEATLPEDVRDRMVGRIETLEPTGRRHRATISYPVDAIGSELTQLLNLLFGNISLQGGIRVAAIDWPDALLTALGGPGHGVSGLRALTGVRDRALLCTALKPLGMSPEALAERARAFALGGMDLIKDDHGLADQPPAPFLERLQRCQEAVTAANAATGGSALYLPNVTAGPNDLPARLWAAREAGCRAVLISPWLTGADALRMARDDYGLALLAHPALTGGLFGRRHGIAPELVLGDLFRAAGADAVIYPNVGGRFGFSGALCRRINDHLRAPLGALRPALPAVGGGVDAERAAYWVRRYGIDTMILIGSSLYEEGDLSAATRRLRAAVASET